VRDEFAPEGWASATWKAALVLGVALVGLVVVPDRLLAFLSIRVTPRLRDLIVAACAVLAFVLLSFVFVRLQRARRG
jgi:formate-dependent nitrite reductase membrane component NrfD